MNEYLAEASDGYVCELCLSYICYKAEYFPEQLRWCWTEQLARERGVNCLSSAKMWLLH